jgi:hypothetical protein
MCVAALSAVTLLVACCSGPGAGIADKIRAANSPIVREVQLASAAFPDSSTDAIDVYIVDDASDAQALDLWCTVVVPAGVSQLPPRAVRLYKGGQLAPEGGRSGAELILTDPVRFGWVSGSEWVTLGW